MAANITATLIAEQVAAFPVGNMLVEVVKLTGSSSAVDDTGTYTPSFAKRPLAVVGGGVLVSINASTGVVTLTAKVALGSNVTYVLVIGTL